MNRHVDFCVGDGCSYCENRIGAAEIERDFPATYDDPGGQDQYERHLDRMGEGQ